MNSTRLMPVKRYCKRRQKWCLQATELGECSITACKYLHPKYTNVSETHGNIIRRADAMGAVQDHFNADGFRGYDDGQKMMDRIKALPSAEPVQPQGNLISRHAAIRWVKTECNPYGKPTLDFESGKKVIEHLKQMPSAEPVHGEWVQISPAKIYECSECGQNVMTDDIEAYKFCHGCGARMGGQK